MAAVIWQKRAWPIYWQFLSKQESTNLVQQQALLRPVFKLLSSYEIVVIRDRGFRSVRLAQWLDERGVYFALRQKHNTYIQIETQQYNSLNTLGLAPGVKRDIKSVKVTKNCGFERGAIAAYWKRKYRGKVEKEAWYILTNLESLEAAIKTYQKRSGIDAMLKDCKSGGYNLENSQASALRLTRLVLLIAIAYTIGGINGQKLQQQAGQKYISRVQELQRYAKHDDGHLTVAK